MKRSLLRPWRPGRGEWDRAAVQHLARRAGFGATPDEVEELVDLGPAGSVTRLFERRGDPDLERSIEPLLAAEDIELLQAWWMALILAGGAPVRERVTLMWHDHFATSNDKVRDVRMMHAQNETLRRLGLGDFRALLHALARDPAMLVWLDGDSNRVGQANENFAREVMELFALGIGHYGERDVQEAARAFSGWGTDGRRAVFRASRHDAGEKELFGRRGRFDAEEALDLVLAHPACPRHVARTLLETFVSPRIDEEQVAELSEALLEHAWHVGRTLQVLLASELFWSPAARRARIAGPVELVAASARTLGAHVRPAHAARQAAAMGQALFRPPSVEGWNGGRAWIHSASWVRRHNLAVGLASGDEEVVVDLGALLSDEGDLVDDALALLLPEQRGGPLAECLRAAADASEDPAEARALVVALALVSPENQLY